MNIKRKPPSEAVRSTTDNFFDAADSKDMVDRDYELFKLLWTDAKRRVARRMYSYPLQEVEDVAAQCVYKFYTKFDFDRLLNLQDGQKRKLVFHFLDEVVRQTVIDIGGRRAGGPEHR